MTALGTPRSLTGQRFRTVTNFYHSPVEFHWAVAEPENGGGIFTLNPLETVQMTAEMAEAAVERLAHYAVVDTTEEKPIEVYEKQAVEQRLAWLQQFWPYVIATIQQAKLKGEVLDQNMDRRAFFRAELKWVNEKLKTAHVYPSYDEAPPAGQDTASLLAMIASLQEKVNQLSPPRGAKG